MVATSCRSRNSSTHLGGLAWHMGERYTLSATPFPTFHNNIDLKNMFMMERRSDLGNRTSQSLPLRLGAHSTQYPLSSLHQRCSHVPSRAPEFLTPSARPAPLLLTPVASRGPPTLPQPRCSKLLRPRAGGPGV